MTRIIALVVALLIPSQASAEFLNGNRLMEECEGRTPFLSGYVAGSLDKGLADLPYLMVLFLKFYDPSKHAEHNKHLESAAQMVRNFCKPDNVTLRQIVDVFCKHLKENPADRNKGGAALLDDAVHAA